MKLTRPNVCSFIFFFFKGKMALRGDLEAGSGLIQTDDDDDGFF